jgi:hypothetical protein
VSDDTDSLTKTTVQKMGQYIRESAADPHVQNCARYAYERMGRLPWMPAPSPVDGVFFFLKHRVRRVLDEGTAFKLGEPGALDVLISPAVLLRMPNPAEDCDGFTMAAAAMLSALGIENCIATVACDPREPERWSHVFSLVKLPNGEWMPLDCSHGDRPGWMVPTKQISRWQAWDLNGNPLDIPIPVRSQLRGYVPRRQRRGVGQICFDESNIAYDCSGGVPYDPTPLVPGIPQGSSTVFGGSGPIQPSSPGFNWAAFTQMLAADATRVASIAELPAGASLTPGGAVMGSIGTSISQFMPLILLGLGAVLVFNMAGKR